jgi:hypothetical protein
VTVSISKTSGSGTHSGWTVAVYGEWRSDDNGLTWNEIGGWPNGTLDTPTGIAGDPGVYGQAYMGTAGQGYLYLPYLLNRDFDPASNDNSPAFLNRAA